MESLRESQEERKALLQLAAAQEEEKKKGFFSRYSVGKNNFASANQPFRVRK